MKSICALLAAVGLVAGHGYVDNATIGGQFYQVRSLCPMSLDRDADISTVLPGMAGEEQLLTCMYANGNDESLIWTRTWATTRYGPT